MNTEDFAIKLSQQRTAEGFTFDCQTIAGEVDVLQVEVNGFDGFPIFITQTQTQIICIIYLWTEAEIKPESRVEMLEMMMDTSITIPLSSYARVGDHYVLYGSLSLNSDLEKVVEEIVTLNENAIDVVSAMEDFLQ
ncbi:MAG: YjfI family protein [Marinicella sp.]